MISFGGVVSAFAVSRTRLRLFFQVLATVATLEAGLTSGSLGKLRGDLGSSLTPQRWCRQGECFGD